MSIPRRRRQDRVSAAGHHHPRPHHHRHVRGPHVHVWGLRAPHGASTRGGYFLYSHRHELVDRSPVLGRLREEDRRVLDRARRGFTIHDPTTVDIRLHRRGLLHVRRRLLHPRLHHRRQVRGLPARQPGAALISAARKWSPPDDLTNFSISELAVVRCPTSQPIKLNSKL